MPSACSRCIGKPRVREFAPRTRGPPLGSLTAIVCAPRPLECSCCMGGFPVLYCSPHANIPPTRKCNPSRGVSFYPLKVGVRDARVSVEFEIQRHPALISSLTPASECHSAQSCTSRAERQRARPRRVARLFADRQRHEYCLLLIRSQKRAAAAVPRTQTRARPPRARPASAAPRPRARRRPRRRRARHSARARGGAPRA